MPQNSENYPTMINDSYSHVELSYVQVNIKPLRERIKDFAYFILELVLSLVSK